MSGTAPERCRKDKEARKQNERKRPEDADERMSCRTLCRNARQERIRKHGSKTNRKDRGRRRKNVMPEAVSERNRKDKEARKQNERKRPGTPTKKCHAGGSAGARQERIRKHGSKTNGKDRGRRRKNVMPEAVSERNRKDKEARKQNERKRPGTPTKECHAGRCAGARQER